MKILASSIKNTNVGAKVWPNRLFKRYQKLPKYYIFFQKGRYFAKSGHTGHHLVPLLAEQFDLFKTSLTQGGGVQSTQYIQLLILTFFKSWAVVVA